MIAASALRCARLCHVSKNTIYAAVRSGALKSYVISPKRSVILIDDVKAWVRTDPGRAKQEAPHAA
jgi:hypothetical protein